MSAARSDTAPSPTADREIVIQRLLNAPRELVWDAWTDPRQADKWWGPDGFTNETISMDLRVGGTWRYMMHGPNDMHFPNRQTFLELHRPERLVYDHGEDVDNDPSAFRVTVTFEAQGNRTQLTMRSIFPTAAQRDLVIREYGALEGGQQTLARLDEYLKTQQP